MSDMPLSNLKAEKTLSPQARKLLAELSLDGTHQPVTSMPVLTRAD